MLGVIIGLLQQLIFASKSQVFLSSSTFTVPANVTSLWVTLVGGGGGGEADNGGGGGGGQAIVKQPLTVSPGDVITVTIGAGGTPGIFGGTTDGGKGGTTSVSATLPSGQTLSAEGGYGGSNNGDGGPGGGPIAGVGAPYTFFDLDGVAKNKKKGGNAIATLNAVGGAGGGGLGGGGTYPSDGGNSGLFAGGLENLVGSDAAGGAAGFFGPGADATSTVGNAADANTGAGGAGGNNNANGGSGGSGIVVFEWIG